ncbi:MAG TPA: ABC transporter substrate-binding protein [Acetobacteraceae bacterium]|jgi:branched-chain amino acid transport system substrate-binding protein|nr:ABC transporter substrate-binding protein [Acetobacteraceae bacterium]
MRRLIGAIVALWLVCDIGSARAWPVGDPHGPYADPGISDNEIVIGLFGPESGPLRNFGFDPMGAAQMWYEMVNKAGGIWGRKIRLVIEDDKCDPTTLNGVARKLVTVDKVFLLNGGSCTPAAVSAQEYVTREKVPFVMLNAAGDNALFPPTRYVFGAFGGTQFTVGGTLFDFVAKQLHVKTAAYFGNDDDFGSANLAAAKFMAEKRGVKLVAIERVPTNIVDVTAPMLRIRQANPDVVVVTSYPQPATLAMQKMSEFAFSMPIVFAVQSVPNPAGLVKNVGNLAAFKDFYYGSPLNDLTDGPRQRWVLKMYKEQFPDRTPTAFMSYGLPSAQAITYALLMAGPNPTRESFIDAMSHLKFDTGVLAGPIEFGPDKRDGHNASIFIKFDGTNSERMPGVYVNEYRSEK